jgi:hypothetical protein
VVLGPRHCQDFSSVAGLVSSWAHVCCLHSNIRLGKLLNWHQRLLLFLVGLHRHVGSSCLFAHEADVRRCVSCLGVLKVTYSVIGCASNTRLNRGYSVGESTFDLDTNSFRHRETIVVLLHHSVSVGQPRHLNYVLFSIFFFLFFQNSFQKIVTWSPVHFQHTVSYERVN